MDLLLSSCFYFTSNALFEEHMENEVFKKPTPQEIFKAEIYLEFEINNIFYFKIIWVRWDKDNADEGYVQ